MPSRKGGKTGSKGLLRAEIEEKLDQKLRLGGANALNETRDRARVIAPLLGAAREFEELEAIIGALQGTHETALESSLGRSRMEGLPCDPSRTGLFERLYAELSAWAVVSRPDPVGSLTGFRNVAFFDAYFSNYIEGTEFDVEEAKEIVFEGRESDRPEDAHDIQGTFGVTSDRARMSRSMGHAQVTWPLFREQLSTDHGQIMRGRPEKHPGKFREVGVRAGQTVFVDADLVAGTLRAGLELLRTLEGGFRRAAFQMFLISEVHPFLDGNGRAARIFMNAELVADGQKRMLIPPVYRDDYLINLKAASRGEGFDRYLRMLDRAQELVYRIDFSDYETAWAQLDGANAFDSHLDSRLVLPPRST